MYVSFDFTFLSQGVKPLFFLCWFSRLSIHALNKFSIVQVLHVKMCSFGFLFLWFVF